MAESAGSVHGELWAVGAELDALPPAPARAHRGRELELCFTALRDAGARGDDEQRREAEDRIWSIWCDHAEPGPRARMVRGIQCLAAGDTGQASEIFDALVAEAADWAEAWNKRATVRFLQGRDAASVADIRRTLALEPRHFGALGGLAQIAVRNGSPDAARAALGRLLRVNPGAPGIAEAVATLERKAPRSVH